MVTAIRWINHAGFIVEHEGVSLVVDPWLHGSVFEDGWDLLSPSVFEPGDWDGATHLWLSHEHPDHFHPPSLREVPDAVAAQLHVVFQATSDHRVADWCRDRFGKVTELDPETWLELSGQLAVRVVPHDNGDSWLAVRTPDGLLLNLNDCVITSRAECRRILDQVGRPDVLMTQFGYANWVGNPGDIESMGRAAEQKMSWLLTQVELLRPAVTIPAASFTWFGHEQNVHLNAGRLDLGTIVHRIEATGTEVQLLYPGDRWELTDVDPAITTAAVRRYEEDAAAQRQRAPRRGETVPLTEVERAAEAWIARLRQRNGPALRLLPPARIHVWDHDVTLRISGKGCTRSDDDVEACDLRVRSDALSAVFRTDWGGRTLDISGRFTVPPRGRYVRFKAYATLAAFGAREERWPDVASTAARRLAKRGLDRIEHLAARFGPERRPAPD